jgi:hypothetical protein
MFGGEKRVCANRVRTLGDSLGCLHSGDESKTLMQAIHRMLLWRRTARVRQFCPKRMTVCETRLCDEKPERRPGP